MSLEDRIKDAKEVLNSLGENLPEETRIQLEEIKRNALNLASKGDTKGLESLRESLKIKLGKDAV